MKILNARALESRKNILSQWKCFVKKSRMKTIFRIMSGLMKTLNQKTS